MDLSYSVITILLPLFMFLFLGLLGMKMPKQLTGILGTCAMLVTTVVAYGVALTYFFDPQYVVDGVRQPVNVLDYTWLTLGDKLTVNLGIFIDPITAMMLIVITTISLMVHARRKRISALLRVPLAFYILHARIGCCNQYFPNVYLLRDGGRFVVPAHRLLL